ncbi:MAG: hypothetical protein AB8B85_10500 [Paracoccaceae bacterium]
MKYLLLPALAAFALTGCTTFTDGASQDITLTSNAPNAQCSITRQGVEIVPASPVPATHRISKRRGDLIVACNAVGYQPQTVALVAGKDPMAVTGVMLTGMLINVGTDAISHSWHEYQDRAYIHMPKSSN